MEQPGAGKAIGAIGAAVLALGAVAARGADDCGRVAMTAGRAGAGVGDDLGRLGARGAAFGDDLGVVGAGRAFGDDVGRLGHAGALGDDLGRGGGRAAWATEEGGLAEVFDVAAEGASWSFDVADLALGDDEEWDEELPDVATASTEELERMTWRLRDLRVSEVALLRVAPLGDPPAEGAIDVAGRATLADAVAGPGPPAFVVGRADPDAPDTLVAADGGPPIAIAELQAACLGARRSCVALVCEASSWPEATPCLAEAVGAVRGALRDRGERGALQDLLERVVARRDASPVAERLVIHRVRRPTAPGERPRLIHSRHEAR